MYADNFHTAVISPAYYYHITVLPLFGYYLVIIWLLFGDSATHTLPISTSRAIFTATLRYLLLIINYQLSPRRATDSRIIICPVYPLCVPCM